MICRHRRSLSPRSTAYKALKCNTGFQLIINYGAFTVLTNYVQRVRQPHTVNYGWASESASAVDAELSVWSPMTTSQVNLYADGTPGQCRVRLPGGIGKIKCCSPDAGTLKRSYRTTVRHRPVNFLPDHRRPEVVLTRQLEISPKTEIPC